VISSLLIAKALSYYEVIKLRIVRGGDE